MGNICVIGPRASGKTTYLASLAYFPNKTQEKTFKIQPLNDESRDLAAKAQNIIREGLSVEPTAIGEKIQTVDDLPYYSFKIDIKKIVLVDRNQYNSTPEIIQEKFLKRLPNPIYQIPSTKNLLMNV